MEVLIKDLVEGSEVLDELLAVRLKQLISYKISRNARKIRYEMRDINESLNALFEKWGDKQPDGRYLVKMETVAEFAAEREEFISQSIEIDVRPLDHKTLGNVEISGNVFDKLWFMFLDDEEGVPEEPIGESGKEPNDTMEPEVQES